MSDNIARPKLLIVDDEQDFLTATAPALSRRGFEVSTALDGATALRMAAEQEFDAVILDLKMPGLDGTEVLRRLRQQWPDLPVIMLTGHGSISNAFEASKQGISDYLSKPCEVELLAARVRELIASARGELPPEGDSAGMEETIRLMIVDDEIELLEPLKIVLQRRRMDVVAVASGIEALECLEESIVDVVVLDVKMPGMDGLTVLERIQRDYPSVRVILLTGHPSVEAAIAGIKLGASEYMRKPPDVEELTATIRKVYRQRLESRSEQERRIMDEIRERYTE